MTHSSVYADDSKISKEKQAELNKLIAEAVKQAGIELDEEELTIVIVKKPGKESESSDDNSEGRIISEISTSGSDDPQPEVEPSLEDNPEHGSTTDTVAVTPLENEDKSAETPQAQQEAPLNDEKEPAALVATPIKTEAAPQNVATTADTTPATEAASVQPAVETAQPSTAPKALTETKELAEQTSPTNNITPQTPATDKPELVVIQEAPADTSSATTIKPVPAKTQIQAESAVAADTSETTPPTSPLTPATDNVTAPETTQGVILAEQPEAAPTIDAASELPTSVPEEYYGNYIPPERQLDAYYSSDITEAINKVRASDSGTGSFDISTEHVASMNLSLMESTEMSDLVVEGALDATAAGGVSTTTLKSAVVVPDANEIDGGLEKELEDEDVEELKEALAQEDLNQRVREALDLLSATQNRGSSTGTATAGTLTASNINVTANINARQTPDATSTFRSTNLRNTNF